MENNNINISNSARKVIEEIWRRARANAFAHKSAKIDYENKETNYYRKTLIFSLLSILFVILVYVFSSEDIKYVQVFSTLCSVTAALFSLYYGIINNHLRYGIRAAEHKFLMNSYQHIAQRAREVKWPDKPEKEIIELLKDLEHDFALLKARGDEPLDVHFDKAHEILKKLRNADIHISQSFDISIEED